MITLRTDGIRMGRMNSGVPLWSCRGAGKSCTLLAERWSSALPAARLWVARCLVGHIPASTTCSPPSGLHRRGSRQNGPRDLPSGTARTKEKAERRVRTWRVQDEYRSYLWALCSALTFPMFHVLMCCNSKSSCSSLHPFSFSMSALQSAGWGERHTRL